MVRKVTCLSVSQSGARPVSALTQPSKTLSTTKPFAGLILIWTTGARLSMRNSDLIV